jgi:hypothetical protein
MGNFAVVKNNIVENVIVAENLEIAQEVTLDGICVEYFDENSAYIGFGYDPVTGEFEQPPTPPQEETSI